ncbi:MAG: GAF domain-containing sensor histidine kinase [Bellilinea sp.]
MTTNSAQVTIFPPIDIAFLYKVNKIIGESKDVHSAMDALVPVIRPYFIFDNVVLFLVDPLTLNLEVAFAKATGRGRSAEADVAWGEIIGSQVVETRRVILQEPVDSIETDRLRRPHTLGLPLLEKSEVLGAIIFIRFGSPPFTPDQTAFAEFLTDHLAVLVARDKLIKENSRLEFQYRTFQVQEDFISTLSHELRTPLGYIKGYSTTLLRTDANWDDKARQEFLTIIDQETDRLEDLLNNLLDSAKLQSGMIMMDFQVVRLDALVKDVIIRAQLHHQDQVFQIEMPDTLRPIHADPGRLAQVLENLVNNAIKYAPGSPVIIRISVVPDGITLEVIDKGAGIPEKYQSKIFDRFFRIPDQISVAHGSGLGLFICKQIVQAHGGKLQLTSRVGEGSSFRIFLPTQP